MPEIPYFPWKGKTFIQISSSIRKNGPIPNPNDGTNMFRAQPLKIYRREIASTTDLKNQTCNERISQSIDGYDMPNGSLIYSQDQGTVQGTVQGTAQGMKGTKDIHLTTNTTERPGKSVSAGGGFSGCTNPTVCAETNARRRVRSSGMIKRQYNPTKNNDTYSTSTAQYLVSRNRTFQQNQYNFIRVGDSSAKPGDTLSVSNIYSANGINHCPKYFIGADVSFQYNWLDNHVYTVDVSAGYYDIDALNSVMKEKMLLNSHYFINKFNNTNVYLLNVTYNNNVNGIELQTFVANNTIFNSANYTTPIDASSQAWINSNTTLSTAYHINANPLFQNAIGFREGNYPASKTNVNTTLSFTSNFTPGIKPQYVPIYYKPNNPQFAQQGGVTASSLIARQKYNAITNSTAIYYKAYGRSVANALAYGVSDAGYTIKDKIGYPLTRTPVFSKKGELVNAVC